ncbi:MAG: DUF859 family phage minor structural protein [Candidatus Ornithomonoglobus sp.]
MTTYGTVLLYGSSFCLEWETLEIDKVYNKSTVRVRLYVTNNKISGISSGNASCFIDGSCGCSFTMDIEGIEWSGNPDASLTEDGVRERTLYEDTFVIQHNSDGKKTVRMCATVTNVTINRGGTTEDIEEEYICRYVALENIPQASEFESIDRDVEVNGENALNIVIAPFDDTCRHDLIISLGNYSETICNAKDSVSYVIPVEWLSAIPAANESVGLITLRTFDSHGMKLGEVQTYWNAYVPEDAVPEFDELTIEQLQGSFSLSFGWIQHASRAHLEIIGAVSNWGADIAAYSIKGCGYSGAEATLDTDTINYSGTRTFSAYVVDSRGKKSEVKTVSINITAYSPPRFLSVLSQRCDSDSTIKNEGSYMLSTVLFEFDSFDGLNTCTQTIYYKKTTDTEYTKLDTSFTNGTPSKSTTIFDISTSYDIQYRLTDKFGVSYYNDILTVSHISMEFLRGGKGIAFGKAAEIENAADFGYKIYAREGIMPVEILQTGNLERNADIRTFSLFAIKTTLSDGWILGFRGLDSDIITGSYAYGGYSDMIANLPYVEAYAVSMTIIDNGDGYTATVSRGSATNDSKYTGSASEYDESAIVQVYALM